MPASVARRALLPTLALCLAGCLAPSTAHLETLGVRQTAELRGWIRFASDGGYRFEMPGVPAAEQERYHFGGRGIETLFFDLRADMNSRGYLLRAFDARALDPMQQEQLRRQAEDQIVRAGERTQARRGTSSDGQAYYEVLVENVSRNQHMALLRTMILAGWVFQMVVVAAPASGTPNDAQHFFESVRMDGPPASPGE